MRESIVLLGSTGSIGIQTIDVARSQGIKITALSSNTNVDLLLSQALEFMPEFVVIADENAYNESCVNFENEGIRVLYGQEGIKKAVHAKCDIVVNALVGFSGLRATYECVLAGIDIALANKESLVVYGKEIMRIAKLNNSSILPVDSEHSAIFQCLNGENRDNVRKIILTASGGPFREKSKEDLKNITVKEALNHPNWKMGKKITIDSATLMNKGLEIIEAYHLFNTLVKDIEVVVHKQSIIHSMVEYKDGSIIAQVGYPDMKVPIAYALSYPERLDRKTNSLSLFDNLRLDFEKPKYETFKCLQIAIDAAEKGSSYCCAMNAANEVCVQSFLEGKIGFLDIPEIISDVLKKHVSIENPSVDDIINVDRETRILTIDLIEGEKK